MTKTARPTLSLRSAPASKTVVEAPVETAPQTLAGDMTCYAAGGTEIMFNATTALICHQGAPGQTEADVAAGIDAIMFIGAFAELRRTGTFMKDANGELNDPTTMYSLIVDAELVARIDAQRQALDDAAGTFVPATEPTAELPVETVQPAVVEDPAFQEDAVFEQTPAEAAEAKTDERPAQTVEAFEIDLTGAEVEFKTTRTGSPCATIRMPGQRTHMAFGEIAEYLRGKTSVTGSRTIGRSTNKIVAIDVPGSNDQLVETPRAA